MTREPYVCDFCDDEPAEGPYYCPYCETEMCRLCSTDNVCPECGGDGLTALTVKLDVTHD